MMFKLWKYCSGLVLAVYLVIAGCTDISKQAAPGVLVSTQWLQEHMNDPGLIILHSGRAEVFDTLHIPGARLILPHDFTVNTSTNRNEMPPADSLAKLLRSVGVNEDSKIVLYNEDIGLLNRTARVYVALDYMGLGEDVKLLNGGLSAWRDEGHETTGRVETMAPGNIEVSELKDVLVIAEELDRQRWNNEVVLIDARSSEEYYGMAPGGEALAQGSHIEGAYSLSYLTLTQDDSPYFFRSDSELEDLFLEAGMDPDKTTLIYCNSGIKGSLNYLVARHLGYPVLLYDGSHEEWEELDLPVIAPVAQ